MSGEAKGGDAGARVGVYELVRRLGRGGMAETYEAVRRGHGGVVQRVCVKRILPVFESDSDFVELFLREARISATLRHANVVQVLDFGLEQGRHFLVLELVDGVDLRQLLRRLLAEGERLPAGVLAHLAVELAHALDYAHAARPDGSVEGVVHRDISPSNVLLSPTGDVKLTDFGVAKAMSSPGLTRSGAAKGKIPYMAPEYARGEEYDARSDLFSLGVLLYECAAGRRPFDGPTDVETLERVHAGRHVPLSDLSGPDVAPALVEAIEALIARDPRERPTTAGALLERLAGATPPPSARLVLGRMVAEASRRALDQRAQLGLEPTLRASPGGTAVVAQSGPARWRVDAAAPDAETRTRLPPTTSEETLGRGRAKADALPDSVSSRAATTEDAKGVADGSNNTPDETRASKPAQTQASEDGAQARASAADDVRASDAPVADTESDPDANHDASVDATAGSHDATQDAPDAGPSPQHDAPRDDSATDGDLPTERPSPLEAGAPAGVQQVRPSRASTLALVALGLLIAVLLGLVIFLFRVGN